MGTGQLPHGDKVKWTGICSDLSLAIGKGIAGYFTDSKALLGDALYTGADAATRFAEVFQKRNGKGSSPRARSLVRDEKKGAEPLLGIVLAVLILMGGLQIAFSAIRELNRGHMSAPSQYALLAVFVPLLIREAVFQYQYRYFRKLGNGSHADYADSHRYSIYTSLTVILGIALAMLGGYLNLHPLLYMDPIAGLLAACFVLRKGFMMILITTQRKETQELPHEDAVSFIDTVQKVHGVIRVEQMKALEQGRHVNLQCTISVNPRISVAEAHEIADCAKKLLQHRFVHVGDVHMDVVPYDPGYPYKTNYELTDSEMPTLLQ
ncbi:cation-efflux pump [Paenibacillus spiritus]|uniref:Cation-efflux pump n=1 Tax=Paenibacillus spiritus TaxID=2496557 RepID=A0A5J5GHZ5_9BACL|nr:MULTISPECIES: cation transporter [Paenibacillus]KAA9007727.1 cation-efflux pump [Paenibacillus spiritus]